MTVDGADFLISPLTFYQREEHLERARKLVRDFPEYETKPTVESVNAQRDLAFYVILCGLNNADESLQLTADDIKSEIDDVLGGRLVREIFEFTGIKLAPEDEKRIAAMTPAQQGESSASS